MILTKQVEIRCYGITLGKQVQEVLQEEGTKIQA